MLTWVFGWLPRNQLNKFNNLKEKVIDSDDDDIVVKSKKKVVIDEDKNEML